MPMAASRAKTTTTKGTVILKRVSEENIATITLITEIGDTSKTFITEMSAVIMTIAIMKVTDPIIGAENVHEYHVINRIIMVG